MLPSPLMLCSAVGRESGMLFNWSRIWYQQNVHLTKRTNQRLLEVDPLENQYQKHMLLGGGIYSFRWTEHCRRREEVGDFVHKEYYYLFSFFWKELFILLWCSWYLTDKRIDSFSLILISIDIKLWSCDLCFLSFCNINLITISMLCISIIFWPKACMRHLKENCA
jgi:hypothetical protein